jgi:septation ring formation regulator EzrA
MASPESPDSREFRQMRHDVDDVFVLLTAVEKAVDGTRETLGTVWGVQRRHGNRLEEIQQSLDLQTGRLDRMEDNQRHQGEGLGRVEGRLDRMEDNQRDQRDRLGRIEDTQQQILALLRGPAES